MNYVKIIIALNFLSFLIQPASSQNNHATVKVFAKGSADAKVYLTTMFKDYFYKGNTMIYQLDKVAESVEIQIPIEKQQMVVLTNFFRTAKLIVAPNDAIEIHFNADDSLKIVGDNAEGQELLNKITSDDTRFRFEELDVKTDVAGRLMILEEMKISDSNKIQQLLNQESVTSSFAKALQKESDLYYKLLWSTDLFFTYRPLIYADTSQKVDPEFVKAWNELYHNLDESWAKSPLFPMLMYRYNDFLSIGEIESNNTTKVPYYIIINNRLRSKLKGPLREYAWANNIISGLENNEYEKAWIDDFVDFQKEFPSSPLQGKLKNEIQKVNDYHQRIANADSSIIISDYAKSYKSIKELMLSMKGKYYYVDLWATWCGPCKAELQYSIKMHDKLEEIGFTPIYLSLDQDKDDAKWKEMVKGYPLKGINLRAGKEMNSLLNQEIPNFNGIPRYLIVNKEGEVVEWNAKRPSDGIQLINQLKELKN